MQTYVLESERGATIRHVHHLANAYALAVRLDQRPASNGIEPAQQQVELIGVAEIFRLVPFQAGPFDVGSVIVGVVSFRDGRKALSLDAIGKVIPCHGLPRLRRIDAQRPGRIKGSCLAEHMIQRVLPGRQDSTLSDGFRDVGQFYQVWFGHCEQAMGVRAPDDVRQPGSDRAFRPDDCLRAISRRSYHRSQGAANAHDGYALFSKFAHDAEIDGAIEP